MSEKTLIGQIIDCPIEELKDLLKKNAGDMTLLFNIKKALEIEYIRATTIKDGILDKIEKGEINKEEGNKVVANLYKILKVIEDKATLIEAFKKERSV